MPDYVCIVGLEDSQAEAIAERIDLPVVSHMIIPGIAVKNGELWVESGRGPRMVRAYKVVYHGIYDNDLDFISALALWGGACLPNPLGMMDCRLKLPNLVRALRFTRFGAPMRGYVSPHIRYDAEIESVAKWGNWHCGENKERFSGVWQGDEPAIIEPFLEGQAVRVVIIGERYWQIKLEGDSWLKSIHHTNADFMDVDEELLADTQTVRQGFGLEIIANDYIVSNDGSKHLLEVNHIPNVDRFPEIWQAYCDYVVEWLNRMPQAA